MAIPISEYIDVTTNVSANGTAERKWNGLVFTESEIISTSSLKDDYDDGKVISVSSNDYASHFAATTDVYKFCVRYFGNSGRTLNVVKILETDTNALAAYNRVIGEFQNFGSFTFLGSDWTNGTDDSGGLLDIAVANADNGYEFFRPTTASTRATDGAAFSGIKGTSLIQDVADTSGLNLGAAAPMGWYSDVDYANDNASATLDYKELVGMVPTVTSASDKTTCDGLHVNYVGLVQAHGFQKEFFQRGVNCNGVDIGVFRDAMWLAGSVEAGWFNLLAAVKKVPANANGIRMVVQMVTGVANKGCDNGTILLNKPLTNEQVIAIDSNYGNGAANSVQTSGYFVSAKLIKDGDVYKCNYVLIYGKGDHIGKVVGVQNLF